MNTNTNRIAAYGTRWPSDPYQGLALARDWMDFFDTMLAAGGDFDQADERAYKAAWEMSLQYERQIQEQR